jgi:hypothetical protein
MAKEVVFKAIPGQGGIRISVYQDGFTDSVIYTYDRLYERQESRKLKVVKTVRNPPSISDTQATLNTLYIKRYPVTNTEWVAVKQCKNADEFNSLLAAKSRGQVIRELVSGAERGEVILHPEASLDDFAFREREAIGSGPFAQTYKCVPTDVREKVVAVKTFREQNRLMFREISLLR